MNLSKYLIGVVIFTHRQGSINRAVFCLSLDRPIDPNLEHEKENLSKAILSNCNRGGAGSIVILHHEGTTRQAKKLGREPDVWYR